MPTSTRYRCACGAEWDRVSKSQTTGCPRGCPAGGYAQVYSCEIGPHEWTRKPTRGPQPKCCPEHGGGHFGARKVQVSCWVCGVSTVKGRTQAKTYRSVCSAACRVIATFGDRFPLREDFERETREAERARRLALVPVQRSEASERIAAYRAHLDAQDWRRFVAGVCYCGQPYVVNSRTGEARFCSTRCASSDAKARRRALARSTYEAPVSWRSLWNDGARTCYICGEPVDPKDYTLTEDGHFAAGLLYPTLDHVVALANGGAHGPSNAALAHLVCNSHKSDSQ